MPVRAEYKFVTTRLKGMTPSPHDASYYNWADVSDMLTSYGMEGWRVSQMNTLKIDDETVLCSFVLERSAVPSATRKPR